MFMFFSPCSLGRLPGALPAVACTPSKEGDTLAAGTEARPEVRIMKIFQGFSSEKCSQNSFPITPFTPGSTGVSQNKHLANFTPVSTPMIVHRSRRKAGALQGLAA